ncbi:MAG: DinB family protein [Candidatus Limnocylindrus sp.]
MNPRNETLNQLMRHMAWANADLFQRLATLPDAALAHTAPGSEWSVGAIAHHLVAAAENYAQRLHGEPRAPEREVPTTSASVSDLRTGLARADEKLRSGAELPGEEMLSWISFNGEPMSFPRWVLVNQAVHHATEHRVQIAGALAANGIASIDLDAIDVWSLYDEDVSAAGR